MTTFTIQTKRRLPELIRSRILSLITRSGLRKGDPLPSYRELCERFKVSLVTVKRAMDELVKEGLVEVQPAKGVFVGKDLAPQSGKLSQLGVIFYCSRRLVFSERYLMEILQGVLLSAEDAGADARLFSVKSDGQIRPEEVETSGVDGVILVGVTNVPLLKSFSVQQTPAVLVDNRELSVNLDCVVVDNYAATDAIVAHLHDLGHTSLGYLDGYTTDTALPGDPVVEGSDAFERRDGFWAALERRGLRSEGRVFPVSEKDPAASAALAADAWITAERRPTALVCYSTGYAWNLIHELEQRGVRVPQDVSVAAVVGAGDDRQGTRLLTCTRVDFTELGRRAVQVLAERCQSPRPAREEPSRVPAQLLVGNTTTRS